MSGAPVTLPARFPVVKPYGRIAIVTVLGAGLAVWGLFHGFGLFAAVPLALFASGLYALVSLARRRFEVVVRADGLELPNRPIASEPLFVPWRDVGALMVSPKEPAEPAVLFFCHSDDVASAPEGRTPRPRWHVTARSLARGDLAALRDSARSAWLAHHQPD